MLDGRLIGILIAIVVLWSSQTYGSAYTHGYIEGCSKHIADAGSIIHVGVWGATQHEQDAERSRDS